MRPQGFLGRQFALRYGDQLQVGPDPQRWQEDDILYSLSSMGADSAGNYILGEVAYRRHLDTMQHGYAMIRDEGLGAAYNQQVAIAMAAGIAGSSAGGEFPKFTACRECDGGKEHVIVKFSGNDNSPRRRRSRSGTALPATGA